MSQERGEVAFIGRQGTANPGEVNVRQRKQCRFITGRKEEAAGIKPKAKLPLKEQKCVLKKNSEQGLMRAS